MENVPFAGIRQGLDLVKTVFPTEYCSRVGYCLFVIDEMWKDDAPYRFPSDVKTNTPGPPAVVQTQVLG